MAHMDRKGSKFHPECNWDRMIELLELAKGSDRSFRQYAKDGGFQHNIFTRVKNHEFCPSFATISHLVSKEAAPRNGVTLVDFMDAAGLSSLDIVQEIDFYMKMYRDYMQIKHISGEFRIAVYMDNRQFV